MAAFFISCPMSSHLILPFEGRWQLASQKGRFVREGLKAAELLFASVVDG